MDSPVIDSPALGQGARYRFEPPNRYGKGKGKLDQHVASIAPAQVFVRALANTGRAASPGKPPIQWSCVMAQTICA